AIPSAPGGRGLADRGWRRRVAAAAERRGLAVARRRGRDEPRREHLSRRGRAAENPASGAERHDRGGRRDGALGDPPRDEIAGTRPDYRNLTERLPDAVSGAGG